MGNRRSCMGAAKPPAAAAPHAGPTGSIVPDQDPLLRWSFARRIVRADIGRDFEVRAQVLGTGYSGAVRLAAHHATGRQVAVKQFTKRRLKAHRLKLLQSEVEVYLRLDHPNICRLLHAYEGKHDVWLVMELCGCELYSRLCERKVYRERDAAELMLQMLQAVNYLHSHRIVHRDLKLENWMYGATDCDDRLKLIDFGFSRVLGCPEETLDMPCGTLHYTSPEVLSRKYTSQCDMWSLGVICYMLLIGRPPFRGQNSVKIAKAIVHGEFPRDSSWESLSEAAQDFVQRLLQKDAALRLDPAKALEHRWITGTSPRTAPDNIDVGVLRSLQKFAQSSHLRRAALTILAYSLTSRELQDLEQTFLAFDTSGRGTITIDQLAKLMQEYSEEVSSQEVQRIFQCFNVANDEEMHYTPFIAALLATRVKLHEDKVRAAFETFDRDGSGYITAESLVNIFTELSGPNGSGGLTREDAEQWIREMDFKGNGVIDYDEFLAALTGQKLWTLPLLNEGDDTPTVRVFEDDSPDSRPRGMSESFASPMLGRSGARWRHRIACAIIDGELEPRGRSHSFAQGVRDAEAVQVRNVSCDVDERYFT